MVDTAVHGGDLDIISRKYGIKKSDIVNFSGNVNPLGPPESVKKTIIDNVELITGYPDISYAKLRNSISEYTNVNAAHCIVGNGSTELISMFIRAVAPKKAVIISPAYSEYQKEIELVNGEIVLFPLKEENGYILSVEEIAKVLDKSVDMLVLCNPNNPTGTYVDKQQMLSLIDICERNGIYLFVDETYIEFSDTDIDISAMPLVNEHSCLCVIRGTSKFFACPGLRLGYGACSDEKIKSFISRKKDPWSVNVFAEKCGTVMFVDKEFIKRSRDYIISERKRLKDILKACNKIEVYNTQANFFLIKILTEITSKQVFETLLKQDLLVRDASSFPYLTDKHLRFCILDKESNDRLLESLFVLL